MSGTVAGQIRSAAGKLWSDRFDLDGFGRFCRARFPTKTAAHVAAETGLPADSVKKWIAGEAVPGGKALLALLCIYGPELAFAMLNDAPAWLNEAARQERQRALEASISRQRAELEQLQAVAP